MPHGTAACGRACPQSAALTGSRLLGGATLQYIYTATARYSSEKGVVPSFQIECYSVRIDGKSMCSCDMRLSMS